MRDVSQYVPRLRQLEELQFDRTEADTDLGHRGRLKPRRTSVCNQSIYSIRISLGTCLLIYPIGDAADHQYQILLGRVTYFNDGRWILPPPLCLLLVAMTLFRK